MPNDKPRGKYAGITRHDAQDGLTFLAALAVLPFLPNRMIGPMAVFNPFAFWRLLLVMMGLSAAGYWAARLMGPRRGLMVAGFATGFVSSTIGIAAMSARAHDNPPVASAAAAGAMASIMGSLIYLIVLVMAADAALLRGLALPFLCAFLPALGYALLLAWRARSSTPPDHNGRAFDLKVIAIFAGLVGIFSFLSALLVERFGAEGMMASAVATGFVDAHATAVSIATLVVAGKVDMTAGGLAILIGLSANMAIKIPAAFALGPRPFALQLAGGIALLIAGLWCGYGLAILTQAV
jgi:uncharacterized membrane protein (DUF4010 family)